MQATGYSLSVPSEPEPRNVVADAPPTASASNIGASTATQAAAIEASASAANVTAGEVEEAAWGWADRSQILRSYQRDVLHVSRLQDMLSDLMRGVMGSRRILANQISLSVLSKVLYYGLTFGLGSQTLGEEYVEIYPYVKRRRNFPTRLRRLVSLFFLIGAPHLLPNLLHALIRRLQPAIPSDTRTRRQRVLDFLTSSWTSLLPEIWFAWFLIRGRNMEWTKSLMGMSYITGSPAITQKPPSSYEPIGFLLLLPVLNRLIADWQARRAVEAETTATGVPAILPTTRPFKIDGKPITDPEPHSDKPLPVVDPSKASYTPYSILPTSSLANSDRQCPLCLSPAGLAAESEGTCVTECGHVFCWNCIQDWSVEKMECPLCRQALRLERLTPAYNL